MRERGRDEKESQNPEGKIVCKTTIISQLKDYVSNITNVITLINQLHLILRYKNSNIYMCNTNTSPPTPPPPPHPQ